MCNENMLPHLRRRQTSHTGAGRKRKEPTPQQRLPSAFKQPILTGPKELQELGYVHIFFSFTVFGL